jgi:uncharacterized protein (TIGR02001 family)
MKMARGSCLAGNIKSGVLGLVALGALAVPANAEGPSLSANVALTSDYVFRGISQTAQNPAIQGGFDLSYGIFWAGVWASNLDFGGGPFGQDIANLEIDYYAGISPVWKGITFTVGGLMYTYPGACDAKCGTGDLDYFELKTGLAYTFAEKLTLSVNNYWSPDYSGGLDEADALEFGAAYAFAGKLFNFFTPSVSGALGWQWFESNSLESYTYWNAGLTLGFLEKWSADVRYWDTDLDGCHSGLFSCEATVVGTIKAVF